MACGAAVRRGRRRRRRGRGRRWRRAPSRGGVAVGRRPSAACRRACAACASGACSRRLASSRRLDLRLLGLLDLLAERARQRDRRSRAAPGPRRRRRSPLAALAVTPTPTRRPSGTSPSSPATGSDGVGRALVDEQAGAQVVADRVEAVDRGRLVEDVVHQALDAVGVAEGLEHLAQVAPTGRTALASARRSAITGRASVTAGVPVLDASPSESTAGIAACENGPRRRTTLLMSPALGAEVGQHRRRLRPPASRGATIVGSSSSRNSRQRLDVVRERGALLGRRLGHLAGVADRARDARAVARERRQHRVRVDRELLERGVLAGEDREHLVGLLQRRVRAPDHLVEVACRGRRRRCRAR